MTGIVVLVLVSILILLGLAQRVLARLYLSDRGSLLVIGLMIVGSFINIPLWQDPKVSLNVGGALVPLGLSIYVLARAGSRKEWLHSLIGITVTCGVLYGVSKMYDFDISAGFLEPQYLWAIIAAVVAYVIGRSRRLAFVVATLGLLFMDIIHIVEVAYLGLNAPTQIGGAGAFDTIVIAGVGAVLLAELIGEGREMLQGGADNEGKAKPLRESLAGTDKTGEDDGQ